MSSEPNLLDYASAAANVQQTVQLRDVQQILAQIQASETSRQLRDELENELKQFIFEQEERLELLSQYFDRAPSAVLMVVESIENVCDDLGITPAIFREFIDKDRAKKMRAMIAEVKEASIQRLTSAELSQVELCKKHQS